MKTSTSSHAAEAASLDSIHAVLSDRRRRFVVDILVGRQSPISLNVLARAVATRIPAAPADSVAGDAPEEIATTLHHRHLPKLAEANVLEYDPETKTVTPRDTDRLAPFLKAPEAIR